MSKEYCAPTAEYRLTDKGERLKNLGQRALIAISGGVLAVSVAPHAVEAGQEAFGPEFHGTSVHTVAPGETINGIINTYVDGGASHTGEVREYVVDLPANEQPLADGHLNPGEKLIIPRSVK